MVTNGNLGDIKYTYLRTNDETLARNPLGVLKSRWNDLEFNKIYLAKIVCGSDYVALVQKYSSHLHGSAAIFSYEKANPIYAKLNNGTWTDTTLITNTDLSTYYSMDNAIEISKNADLNNYHQFGNYISTAASTTDTLKNCPLTGSGFTMHVERITGSRPDYCKQRIIANNSNAREYWRTKIEGVWQKWYMVVGEQVN